MQTDLDDRLIWPVKAYRSSGGKRFETSKIRMAKA